MEDVGTGRVCVDKIGDTDQTITVIVDGGVYNYDHLTSLFQTLLHCFSHSVRTPQ